MRALRSPGPIILSLLALAGIVIAVFAAREFYDLVAEYQRRDRNYAELMFVVAVPLGLGALASAATRSLLAFAITAAAAALATAGYAADEYASPLTYDNSSDYVASVYVSIFLFFASTGLLAPLGASLAFLGWEVARRNP